MHIVTAGLSSFPYYRKTSHEVEFLDVSIHTHGYANLSIALYGINAGADPGQHDEPAVGSLDEPALNALDDASSYRKHLILTEKNWTVAFSKSSIYQTVQF